MGLYPTVPVYEAGNLTEPPVSLPIANRQSPPEMAAEHPLELPPGLFPSSKGFKVDPKTLLSPRELQINN